MPHGIVGANHENVDRAVGIHSRDRVTKRRAAERLKTSGPVVIGAGRDLLVEPEGVVSAADKQDQASVRVRNDGRIAAKSVEAAPPGPRTPGGKLGDSVAPPGHTPGNYFGVPIAGARRNCGPAADRPVQTDPRN